MASLMDEQQTVVSVECTQSQRSEEHFVNIPGLTDKRNNILVIGRGGHQWIPRTGGADDV
jgi:hypothetical protein